MSERREKYRTQELDYLYQRLKRLEDAIRSIEALARMSPETKDLPPENLPTRGKGGEEPT
jgi:hypothetical protein